MVLFAGGWKKGFSTCCIRTDLALAGLAQKRVETLQILSVCVRAEAGHCVCKPISLRESRVSWHWSVISAYSCQYLVNYSPVRKPVQSSARRFAV